MEVVGGDIPTKLLDFWYTTLELLIDLVVPEHCQWREFEERPFNQIAPSLGDNQQNASRLFLSGTHRCRQVLQCLKYMC